MVDAPSNSERTWLCSVVFTDIVNYSSQPVQLQMEWKKRFNHYLAEAISEVPVPDRVILDTGDGAAICFLGDPETALQCAQSLRSSFANDQHEYPSGLLVRIGINLGSVKLVKDLNGSVNVVGDGINVGQRIMSFADHNQVMVSRSFYEVISCLSDEYSRLFSDRGTRKDKHQREHSVYEMMPEGAGAAASTFSHTEPAGVPANQTTGETAAPHAAARFEPEALREITQYLAGSVGPIARHLVYRASCSAPGLPELCRELATHIQGDQDRAEFLRRCASDLGAAPPALTVALEEPRSREKTKAESVNWDSMVLKRATDELAAYIGPAARLIVNRTASKALNTQELYEALSKEIDSNSDRQKFLSSLLPNIMSSRGKP